MQLPMPGGGFRKNGQAGLRHFFCRHDILYRERLHSMREEATGESRSGSLCYGIV